MLESLHNVHPKPLRESSRRLLGTVCDEADKVNVQEIQDKIYDNTYYRVI